VADFEAQARREAQRKGLETIDVYGAMSLRQQPGVVFLDARTPGEFQLSHVAGARNLPQETIYGDLGEATKALGLTPDDRLVVYCGDILCDKSKELAEALRTAGFAYGRPPAAPRRGVYECSCDAGPVGLGLHLSRGRGGQDRRSVGTGQDHP
jgi:rhodanese-related sulfurtransferase